MHGVLHRTQGAASNNVSLQSLLVIKVQAAARTSLIHRQRNKEPRALELEPEILLSDVTLTVSVADAAWTQDMSDVRLY